MFTLSHLPIEILYLITNHLAVEDIVILARLNSWYSYWLSFILGERIHQQIDQEGWRIHVRKPKGIPEAIELIVTSLG